MNLNNEIKEVKEDLKKRIHAVEISCYACADPIRKELDLIEKLEKENEILLKRLYYTEFGTCFMCTNTMKNITIDGINNGCDGTCEWKNNTFDNFKKLIRDEINRMKEVQDE